MLNAEVSGYCWVDIVGHYPGPPRSYHRHDPAASGRIQS